MRKKSARIAEISIKVTTGELTFVFIRYR